MGLIPNQVKNVCVYIYTKVYIHSHICILYIYIYIYIYICICIYVYVYAYVLVCGCIYVCDFGIVFLDSVLFGALYRTLYVFGFIWDGKYQLQNIISSMIGFRIFLKLFKTWFWLRSSCIDHIEVLLGSFLGPYFARVQNSFFKTFFWC